MRTKEVGEEGSPSRGGFARQKTVVETGTSEQDKVYTDEVTERSREGFQDGGRSSWSHRVRPREQDGEGKVCGRTR